MDDRRGEGNSRLKWDSFRIAEIYIDRDCDPAPHIGGTTLPFSFLQASGSTVEGRGERSGGQDGGSGARSQGEGSDRGIGGEGDRDADIGGGGQGEGNGDEGGNEGQGKVGDVENRREARNARLTRLAEIFIACKYYIKPRRVVVNGGAWYGARTSRPWRPWREREIQKLRDLRIKM